MDDHKQGEEQVEDLDAPAEEAEDVRGGFSFGVEREMKESGADLRGQKVRPGGLDGIEQQHNQTLVRI